MATSPHSSRPEDRLIAMVNKLQQRVTQLESSGNFIPVLIQDPAANSGTNIWALSDGRLRIRRRDGVIIEYTSNSPGSSTSGSPAVITMPAQKQVVQTVLTASLSGTYDGSNSLVSGNDFLQYGQVDASGPYKSLWLFDLTGFSLGSPCTRMELFLHGLTTYNGQTGLQQIGTCATNPHGLSTAPATWPGISNVGSIMGQYGQGDPHWMDIDPVKFAAGLRTPSFYGFGINQTTNFAQYGSLSGVGGPGLPPQLRLTYYQ